MRSVGILHLAIDAYDVTVELDRLEAPILRGISGERVVLPTRKGVRRTSTEQNLDDETLGRQRPCRDEIFLLAKAKTFTLPPNPMGSGWM